MFGQLTASPRWLVTLVATAGPAVLGESGPGMLQMPITASISSLRWQLRKPAIVTGLDLLTDVLRSENSITLATSQLSLSPTLSRPGNTQRPKSGHQTVPPAGFFICTTIERNYLKSQKTVFGLKLIYKKRTKILFIFFLGCS